jgi:2-polyprenyl-6-hydroxyphenyl methylase/3-demethylubiquinone-9 3-methyltransferase
VAGTLRIELDSASPDAIDGRQLRAVSFQAVRLEYVQSTMAHLGLNPGGGRALVVGGGRGVLPRGLARLGFEVLAVDASARATELAGATTGHGGPDITYRTAPAEELGVPAGTFDVAYLADTLEITPELDRVLEQARLALRPGGVLFYDTVNRTLLARLVYLVVFQGLPLTRIMPPGRYAASRLRGPGELGEALARHGLRNEDVCDFKPRNPASLLKAVLARRRGAITDEQIPPIVDFVRVPDGSPLVTYLGYARRV